MSNKLSKEKVIEWLEENASHIKLVKWAGRGRDISKFTDSDKNVNFEYSFNDVKKKIEKNPNHIFRPSKNKEEKNLKLSEQGIIFWLQKYAPHVKLLEWSGSMTRKSKFLDIDRNIEFEYAISALKTLIKSDKNILFGATKEEFKEKQKQTWLKKYGVEHISKSPKVREKVKGNNIKKYGVENPMQINTVKEKRKEDCIEKYGVDHVLKYSKVREKIEKTRIEKGIVKLYEGKNALEWSQDPNLPSHTTILRAINNGIDPRKLQFTKSYIETVFQNYLEQNLNLIKDKDFFCNKILPEHKDLKSGYKIPDFLLPEYNLIIECDGEYYHPKHLKYKDKERNRTYIKLGYNLLIFSGNQIKNRFDYVERQILKKMKGK